MWVIGYDGGLYDISGCSMVYSASRAIATRTIGNQTLENKVLATLENGTEEFDNVRDHIAAAIASDRRIVDLRELL